LCELASNFHKKLQLFFAAKEVPDPITVSKYFDEKLAIKIVIPILAVICILVIAVSLLHLFRKEISLLWNTYINPANKGKKTPCMLKHFTLNKLMSLA